MATTLQSAATAKVSEQLDALLHRAAIAPLNDTGWIRVTGSDRVRWLNGMVTNSIATLAPGEGCYNFVLNAQGRIQGDLTAFMLEDSILLETTRDQIPTLLAHFDRFIIMDDVEITESGMGGGLLVAGPHALEILASTNFKPTVDGKLRIIGREDTGDELVCAASPIVPRYEIWCGSPQDYVAIASTLRRLGAILVTPHALESLRILEGTPRYATDIRNTESAKNLPQETAQTHALHFSKGCYLGQEIVERIHSRGNVHRTFTGFQLIGTLPTSGTALQAEGKPVGELTSIAAIDLPTGPLQLALGYIRREALERNLPLEYPGGTASPIQLPYPGVS